MSGLFGAGGPSVFATQDIDPNTVEKPVDPTANDDSTQGYQVGSHWINVGAAPRRPWICVDNTPGAAVWFLISAPGGAVPTLNNKQMVALVTTVDGDKATNTTVAVTPAGDCYVLPYVNGVIVGVGDGAKNQEIYFSGDGGTTARLIKDIVAGDTIHWVGSIARYQLDANDRISLQYDI